MQKRCCGLPTLRLDSRSSMCPVCRKTHRVNSTLNTQLYTFVEQRGVPFICSFFHHQNLEITSGTARILQQEWLKTIEQNDTPARHRKLEHSWNSFLMTRAYKVLVKKFPTHIRTILLEAK